MATLYTGYDIIPVEASELFNESIIEVHMARDRCRFTIAGGHEMALILVPFKEMTGELWQVFNERYKDKTGIAFCIHSNKV